MEKLSIIIVHWNTPQLLKQQLESLTGINQVIVVDNNSIEPLVKVRSNFPRVKFIKNKFNHGYSFACNQGLLAASGEWLLYLNPDTQITTTEIKKLIEFAESNTLDAVSPTFESSSYQKPVPSLFSLAVEFTPLNKFIPLSIFRKKTLVGGCLLIKKSVLENLGGWDERFFLWFEDSDLTKRLLTNKNKIGFADFSVKHLGGSSFQNLSTTLKKDIFFHSMAVYTDKYFSKFGKNIISLIKKKYSHRNLLPVLNQGVSLTVPNKRKNLLIKFLGDNKEQLKNVEEFTIVSSSLNEKLAWQLKNVFPNLRVIFLAKNKGFAHTVNTGFRAATTTWLATVNDDTVTNSLWLDKCLKCAGEEVGSINPVIKDEENNIESIGISIKPFGKAVVNAVYPKQSCTPVQASNAAAVLYQNSALNKVGLFDERFGSYLEDIDLSLRLWRKGFKNLICSNACIVHKKHQTSKYMNRKKRFLDMKNWWLVIFKNWSYRDILRNLPAILLERLRNFSGFIKNS